jgi:hypothetical protein
MLASVELAILAWVLIGAGIAAGAFVVARATVEVVAVGYRFAEKSITGAQAGRRGIALVAGAGVALFATAVIAAIAILAIFSALLSNLG